MREVDAMLKIRIGCIIIAAIIVACLFLLADFYRPDKIAKLRVCFCEDKFVLGNSEYFMQRDLTMQREESFGEDSCFTFGVLTLISILFGFILLICIFLLIIMNRRGSS